jgi:arginyl-tRNA synthetase
VGYERHGNDEELAKDAITHLYNVYVAINKDANAEVAALVKEARAKEGRVDDPAEPTKPELDAANAQAPIHSAARAFFRRMEDGDEAALATWRKFRDLSIVKYREVYKRLNIDFDVYGGESQVSQKTMVRSALLRFPRPETDTAHRTRSTRR